MKVTLLGIACLLPIVASAQNASGPYPSGRSVPAGPVDHGRNGIWFSSCQNAPQLEEAEEWEQEVSPSTRSIPPIFTLSGALGLSAFKGYISNQVNVDGRGRNIPGDAANEPSMTIDPTNSSRVAVGWRQFDSVLSDFRQGGFSSSADGGRTWRGQGNLERGVFRSDPVLATSADGKFYYNSLKLTFFDDVFPSTNQGASWGPTYYAATGGDKQWMTVDQTTGIGRGNLYQAWSTAGNNYGGRQFSRSTDGGKTWSDPSFIPSSPIWGTLDVGKNGDLYLAGLSNPFSFLKSTNAKDPRATPTWEAPVSVNLGGSIVYGSFVNPVGLMGQTWLACDKSGGPNAGNIYMLCSVGVDDKNPCDVNFVRSTDGGKTWSAPMRINDDARNRGAHHWFGTLAVAPNGRLDAVWNDTRANPGSSISALYISSSFDGGKTWSKNLQVSQTFNPNVGYPQQQKMGDYLALISDNSAAKVAYAATFNGEQDVWFLRVPVAAGNPLNASAVSVFQGTYAGGGLADVWQIDNSTYDVTSTFLRGVGHFAAIETAFDLPVAEVSRIEFGITATAIASSTRATSGFLWLYNYQTKVWDIQQSFPIGVDGKVSLTVVGPSVVSPYVGPGNRVRTLFRTLNPSVSSTAPPFRMRSDQIQLRYG